jgi:glucose-6-phosphate isomerase
MPATLPLHLDSAAWLDERLGPAGVRRADIQVLSPRLDGLRQRLRAWRAGTTPSFYHLPFRDDSRAIAARGARLARDYARTVVLGIGGSSLGGEMLVRILGRAAHAVRFFDNVDPTTLTALDELDWRTTALLVISKSGETAETLVQFLGLLPRLEAELGARLRDQVIAITENPDGALARIAADLGLETLPHPPVGGRFSVLSVVGLLPAAAAGVDIEALLAGARAMAEACARDDILDNPAFFHGAAQVLHAERGRRLSVFMAYSERLRPLGLWYRQLWGESLGKRDRAGRPQGLSPVLATGVTDQHSQLQLYLDGPDDKQFTLVCDPALAPLGRRVPPRYAELPAVAPLVGHSSGELLLAEFRATRETLTRHARPNRTLEFDSRDPAALGAAILLLELETVVVAELLGVDPFDQPAVEEGKRLARDYLRGAGA